MNVTRSIAYGIVGQCKTEASQKPVPVHSILAASVITLKPAIRYRFKTGQRDGRRRDCFTLP